MRFTKLSFQNFLSYRSASIDFGDLTVLVGQNSAGKSNAVSALRLLREIPTFGLPTALARRGGFDQLRHRTRGHPFDPSLAIDFTLGEAPRASRYELQLGSVKGKRYYVKSERATLYRDTPQPFSFERRGKQIRVEGSELTRKSDEPRKASENWPDLPPDQSAIPLLLGIGGVEVWEALRTIQTVEINPARVGDLQEPTPPFAFEPDGSNTASIFEGLENKTRRQLVDHLAALVPGVTNIQPRQLGDKLTLIFTQTVEGKNREFSAKQMSDGTLRAFGILTALMKPSPASLLVIEEPETAIHLGALRTLVEIFRAYTDRTQIVITTHSADIVDAVDLSQLRVVWSEGGSSRIAPIAAHAREPIQRGLITPGELLRSDSLDPAQL